MSMLLEGKSIVKQNKQKVRIEEIKRLDSSLIAHNIVHLVKTNSGIEIKTLITDMHQRFGYTVPYKKAWTAKQKALEMIFGSWEQSYNYLPVWLTTAQHFVPGTVVKYKTSTSMEEGDVDPPRMILNHVFWTFNSCIEGFKYCKPLVQVDETFLTSKYRGTLLTTIEQDDSRNNFPLAFAIVESLNVVLALFAKICYIATKFVYYIRQESRLLVTLQSERVGWNELDVSSVYCIRHVASNLNKQFKNIDLKKQVINIGYEMRKPRFEAKLLAMRTEFSQATDWLDQIPKNKWTLAYDEEKRYDHMTTNLAECMNFVLKGAQTLPITALVSETFNKINDSFVTNDIKIMNMIKARHRYSEDVYVMMQENQHIATSHYVQETGKFEVQEITNMRLG
ncbi:hypothetical protein HKD37_03G007364 [Glycine soja]